MAIAKIRTANSAVQENTLSLNSSLMDVSALQFLNLLTSVLDLLCVYNLLYEQEASLGYSIGPHSIGLGN